MVIFEGLLKDKNSLRTRKYSHYNFILSIMAIERTKPLLFAVYDSIILNDDVPVTADSDCGFSRFEILTVLLLKI